MAVKVRRERPDQRRHHRVSAPLFVDVAGWRVRAADWSLGGLRIEGFPDALPAVGEEVPMHLTLPFQGFDVSFDAKAEVVRINEDAGMFAVRFTELGERERELMSHFIEDLVRGSMSVIEDTIQRIDVPVTPASLKPDPSPAEQVPVRRWPVRTMVMTAIYAFVGLIVFGYAAVLMYSNFYRMEVQTAVINAPVETVRAPNDGRVAWTNVKPGDRVRSGQLIVKVFDHRLERDIDIAAADVREQKAKLNYLKRRHHNELERAEDYATVEIKNVRQERVRLEALKEEYGTARRRADRLKRLFDKGFSTNDKYEDALRESIRLRKEIQVRALELQARAELTDRHIGKRLFTGSNIVGEVRDVAAEVKLAQASIKISEQKHQALVDQRDRLSATAPFDGTVIDLPRGDNGFVRPGDVVAIIEKDSARHVLAYLTQDEVVRVGLGDRVTMYVPAVGKSLKGRVVNIDRTSGFVREQDARHNPGYSWRGPSDRSAKVSIAFEDDKIAAGSSIYKTGMPVVVIFAKQATDSLFSELSRRFAQFQ